MRRAQLIGLSIALGAGLLAFVGMRSALRPAPVPVIHTEHIDAVQVLVARTDIPLGQITNDGNFRWQDWPRENLNPSFVTRGTRPDGVREFSGSIARSSLTAGEPITEAKLVKPGAGGVLAAILPSGMRAISTKITEQSAVGKLILPNDRVDVILTQRKRGRAGAEEFVSDTILRDVRVLAIGQQIDVKDGKKNAEGNVATLELTSRQSELLALGNTMGEISLALRSVADLVNSQGPTDAEDQGKPKERTSGIRVLRYGVKQRAYGVN
jgi:pilus assembly protein CpaB